jgi:hypothetical protein
MYRNIQPDGNPHTGNDYAYTDGVNVFPEIFAAAAGTVLYVGDSRKLGWPNPWYFNPDFDRSDAWDSSAGNVIVIGHTQGWDRFDTTYSHVESWTVKVGDIVKAGQRIGTIGNTGNSYGKHLHFELLLKPFNFNTPTYGRTDPNPYFGSGAIGPQGTITPEEIDMSAEANLQARITEVVAWQDGKFRELGAQAESNRNALAGFVRDCIADKDTITEAELNAKFAELTAAQQRAGQKLYKGDDSPHIYVWDASTGFRHIMGDEYTALVTAGAWVQELPQKIIDDAIGGK